MLPSTSYVFLLPSFDNPGLSPGPFFRGFRLRLLPAKTNNTTIGGLIFIEVYHFSQPPLPLVGYFRAAPPFSPKICSPPFNPFPRHGRKALFPCVSRYPLVLPSGTYCTDRTPLTGSISYSLQIPQIDVSKWDDIFRSPPGTD